MKQTINFGQFSDGLRNEGFSYRGLEHLFAYLSEIEADTGVELEFDPVAIRCEFAECSAVQLAEDYGFESDNIESDEWYSELIKWLEREGAWFEWVDDETIIYENF